LPRPVWKSGSWNVAASHARWLIQEEVAVAGGGLGILIYSDDDRLHMLIAVIERRYPNKVNG
jgi:hypothetical protein